MIGVHSQLPETGAPHPAKELRKAPQGPPHLLTELGGMGSQVQRRAGKTEECPRLRHGDNPGTGRGSQGKGRARCPDMEARTNGMFPGNRRQLRAAKGEMPGQGGGCRWIKALEDHRDQMAEILVYHVEEAGLYLESGEEFLRASVWGSDTDQIWDRGWGTQGTTGQLESRNCGPA